MTEKLKFKCPECKGEVLEEIVRTNFISLPITYIHSEYEIEYDHPTMHDGDIDRYECINCGYILRENETTIDCSEDLVNWLREHDVIHMEKS